MTDRELVIAAATKIMGWSVDADGDFRTQEGSWIPELGWNPLESVEDAFMLVDKLADRFMFRLGSNPWVASLHSMSDGEFSAVETDRRRAITVAALRAVGVKA